MSATAGRENLSKMSHRYGIVAWAGAGLLAGGLLLGGCSTKSGMVTASGTEPTSPRMEKTSGGGATMQANQGGNMQAGAGSEALQGFSKNPAEEHVAQPAPMVVAKAEPSAEAARRAGESAARQLADIYFAFDKWTLSREGMKNLAESADFLKQHPEAKLVIEGYCDERGSREYNLVLGEKRAKESRRYLASLGVKNPVSITSYGKERQVCGEPDESCYWKNRRGHLVVAEGLP